METVRMEYMLSLECGYEFGIVVVVVVVAVR